MSVENITKLHLLHNYTQFTCPLKEGLFGYACGTRHILTFCLWAVNSVYIFLHTDTCLLT